jgi:hypothetical protein
VIGPLSVEPVASARTGLGALRDDHATIAGLHSYADLPRPVSLLLCDALIDWAFLTPCEPPPRPPAPHLDVEQVLTGVAARLVAAVPATADVASKLTLGRVARQLGLAARALGDVSALAP